MPHFNEDLFAAGPFPPSVDRLRTQLKDADGFLFAIPEYNFAFPGVVKDAVDWGSIREHLFKGKAGAILGAGGAVGANRASMAFRHVLAELRVQVRACCEHHPHAPLH